MINQVYQLIEPRKIQVSFRDLSLIDNKVIVRPTHLSICAADQRYYTGARPKEYLKKKLPMALIHEASGMVVYDKQGDFVPGDKVVLIPNTPCQKDEFIAENYLFSSKFRASGFDGFMQEYVAMARDRLVQCNGVDPRVASVSELISVAMHSINTFIQRAHGHRNVIGIWGDGNLGYLTALLLHNKVPSAKQVIIGVNPDKLQFFSFADNVYLFDELPQNLMVDHAFECVGGQGSEPAIAQIIDHINPEGMLVLMGVSENPVSIATRMVLEKGLELVGRSRSGRCDFVNTIQLIRQNPHLEQSISKVLSNVIPVSSIKDISRAFEMDLQTPFKTIMQWNI